MLLSLLPQSLLHVLVCADIFADEAGDYYDDTQVDDHPIPRVRQRRVTYSKKDIAQVGMLTYALHMFYLLYFAVIA